MIIYTFYLQLHEFDDKRFDIRAHDCTYFFRASSPREKEEWMEIIENNKVIIIITCIYIYNYCILLLLYM